VPHILIATPAYGDIFYTPFVRSAIGLQKLFERKKWRSSFATISYADIVESRNYLLTRWYDKTDASHILFVDADMGYEPKLIADMVRLGEPVVGVIAPKRQIDLHRLAKLSARGEKPERAIARAHDFVVRPVKRAERPAAAKGFLEVEACGAGILLIERACIKRMLELVPEIDDAGASKTSPLAKQLTRLIRAFDVLTVDGARLSEDYSFCHRWRARCGGKIWANISHEIVHVGLHRFAGRYSDVIPSPARVTVGGAAAGQIVRGSLRPERAKAGTSRVSQSTKKARQ
jgi:hypothetical protein